MPQVDPRSARQRRAVLSVYVPRQLHIGSNTHASNPKAGTAASRAGKETPSPAPTAKAATPAARRCFNAEGPTGSAMKPTPQAPRIFTPNVARVFTYAAAVNLTSRQKAQALGESTGLFARCSTQVDDVDLLAYVDTLIGRLGEAHTKQMLDTARDTLTQSFTAAQAVEALDALGAVCRADLGVLLATATSLIEAGQTNASRLEVIHTLCSLAWHNIEVLQVAAAELCMLADLHAPPLARAKLLVGLSQLAGDPLQIGRDVQAAQLDDEAARDLMHSLLQAPATTWRQVVDDALAAAADGFVCIHHEDVDF